MTLGRPVLAFLLSLVVAPAWLSAQQSPLAGRIVDQTNAPMAGVTVRATTGGRPTVTVTTDNKGQFRFDRLPTGHYTLTCSAIGFADAMRRDIVVSSDSHEAVNLTMRLAIGTSVVVTAQDTFRNLADLDHPEASLVGIANAASEGAVTAAQIAARPVMRAGEVLESVPGVIISQHSGEGKANQYYLRGFNLDHGTDFATTVAGLPVNLPSNAHGQGYSDLNFLIPELVTGVQFKKGPYDASEGDFAAAGAANINYASVLEHPFVSTSAGAYGWLRTVAAASPKVGGGHLLGALEVNRNDGPWTRPDDYDKVNGVLRYSRGDLQNAFSVTGLAYDGSWNSTDQVPDRAIADGRISRFGAIDPTDGGRTARYSVVGDFQHTTGSVLTQLTVYASHYRLNLFSNFTYDLDDPVHGDQFEQADRRWTTGASASQTRRTSWNGRRGEFTFGGDVRNDVIPTLGLYHTEDQVRLSTTREDAVVETSAGFFAAQAVSWTPWLRTTAGLRVDGYRFDVASSLPENSGVRRRALVSPKGGAVLGPWRNTEFYVNAGTGFHSNDARGTTLTIDPATGEPASAVTPLVRAVGSEFGVRSVAIPRVQTTVAIWRLDLASELVFAGDAGTTEASRPSERYGIEWSNYVRLSPSISADADLSWSHARFTGVDPTGNQIPGAPQVIASLGLTRESPRGWFGSLRWRYFGPRPLVEDGSVRSTATGLVNGELGFHVRPNLHLILDGFNLLNAADSDVDYYYISRLPGEPADGIADVHTHPTQPRSVRIGVKIQF